MRIVERINAWALNRLPSRRSAPQLEGIDQTGLQVTGTVSRPGQADRHIPWSSVDRVIGTTTETLAGGKLLLILSLKGGGVLTISEDTATFTRLTDEWHLHLPGARRCADWSVELLGSGGGSIEIFTRSGSDRGRKPVRKNMRRSPRT